MAHRFHDVGPPRHGTVEAGARIVHAQGQEEDLASCGSGSSVELSTLGLQVPVNSLNPLQAPFERVVGALGPRGPPPCYVMGILS